MLNIKKTELGKFSPLIVIFSSIIFFTIATSYFLGFSLAFTTRIAMGAYFLVFGIFKIFNLRAFTDAYITYDILAMHSRRYAFVYPFLELWLGFLYLHNAGGMYRNVFTFLLMIISSIGVMYKLRAKESIPSVSLGRVFEVPIAQVALILDLFMAFGSLLMIFLTIFK